MSNEIQKTSSAASIMESVLVKGDLSKLTTEERNQYYTKVCESLGLNPLTQPFEYLTLNGRTTLYARKAATEQLRKINGISIEIVEETTVDGIYKVKARAKDRDGRVDEDYGYANVNNLKGENFGNAILKAVTKAKRRVTLSISGLGFLDETEVADIPNKEWKAPMKSGAVPPLAVTKKTQEPEKEQEGSYYDPDTGEVIAIEPHKVEFKDPKEFAIYMAARLKACTDANTLEKWAYLNQDAFIVLQENEDKYPGYLERLTTILNTSRANLKPIEDIHNE